MTPIVNKNTELIQILLYLSDLRDKTPHQNYENRQYCGAIEEWFSAYKTHEAVTATKDLICNHHFNYTRPHEAAIRFDDILADPNDVLHRWAVTVKHFAEDSDFDSFFAAQDPYYRWILNHITACNFDGWKAYIENYFLSDSKEFRLIICPLDGNYGINVETNHKQVSCQVCCCPVMENGTPRWRLDFLAKNMAHEYGHCFVNPVVEGKKELLENHRYFFGEHKNMFSYYNLDYAVICEYFVRAFAIRFMEDHKDSFPEFDLEAEYLRQRKTFIFIDHFVKALASFESTNNTFEDFYKNNIGNILSMCEK